MVVATSQFIVMKVVVATSQFIVKIEQSFCQRSNKFWSLILDKISGQLADHSTLYCLGT